MNSRVSLVTGGGMKGGEQGAARGGLLLADEVLSARSGGDRARGNNVHPRAR